MKSTILVFVFLVCALLVSVPILDAQEQEQPQQQQTQAQPVPQQTWSAEQLDNLVAPIALYPDPLLGQILVASTYPLEVVEAYQWLQRNRNLRGQQLTDAAKKQPWDPSIQALVAVPDALEKLNQDIRWTTDLGNAFLAQQADVMSAVQRMRARAQEKGHLPSTPQQTVTTQEQGGKQVIVIQPADPQVIYVPAYDPFYIWGPPVYGYYPPLYYPAFGFGFGPGFNLGFYFGGWGGWFGWGWYPSWYSHSVCVNHYFFHHHGYNHYYGGDYHGGSAWTHDPGHRMNVPYHDSQVAARFGGTSRGYRDSFRAGTPERGGTATYANRSGYPPMGRGTEQRYQGASPQAPSYQNQERQRYQSSQQYRASAQQSGAEPQARRYQVQPQRYQSTQQYRASARQYGTDAQAQRYQVQPQRYQSSQEYRFAPRQYGTEVQSGGYQAQPRYLSSQPYRSVPQVQRFQSQAQPRFQAPQQHRSAPQMSAPRFSGGSVSRGDSGGFSRGSAGSVSRGGGGGSSHGGGNHRR